MTTQEKLMQRKLSVLELAEYLQNVSEACRVMGVSRQHFYDIRRAFEAGGLEALRDKNRRKPNFPNRAPPHVEQAACELARENPALGQVRVANELRKRGIEVSPAGVRPSPRSFALAPVGCSGSVRRCSSPSSRSWSSWTMPGPSSSAPRCATTCSCRTSCSSSAQSY
ncbi:MAG: helix-turn-helix domain-containing protein [Gemmatimonadales bacterium]|nr:helix-turn-helix domain-containing protein [Gemmatimonadales bacterium]NIQ99426.1 helix-turn-helix domain-containing protein [Gemmatimonadales bacterium]NIS64094.1 helix-turn-helix domain-containing protein [Gemmatimonadales bacterium]